MNKLKQFAKLIFMFIFQNDKLGKMYVEWGCKVSGSKVHDDNYKNVIDEIYNPENKVKMSFNPKGSFLERFEEYASTKDIENMLTDLSYKELT